jgi:hypothetical protein
MGGPDYFVVRVAEGDRKRSEVYRTNRRFLRAWDESLARPGNK